MATRGTLRKKHEPRKPKQELVPSTKIFTGEISREHEKHPRYGVSFENKKGFESQGKLSLEQLKEKYPDAKFKLLK